MSLAAFGAALPGRRRLAALVAGRAGLRLAQWVSGIGLLAAWGPAVFATYATALATSAWLMVLVSAGAEKALLALGPRRGGERLPRLLVRFSMAGHGVGLTLLALAAVGQGSVLRAAATAYSTGVGLLMVLIAVLRLRGRQGWDPAGVSVIAGAHLLVVPIVHLTGIAPPAALAVLALAATGAAALLLRVVVRDRTWRLAEGPQPGVLSVVSTVAYLGATEIASLVGAALVYRELAESPDRRDAAALYLALVVSGALLALVLYLTRLAAPHLARHVDAAGPAAALALGGTVFRRTAAAATVALAVAVPAVTLVLDGGPVRVAAFAAALVAVVLAEGGVLYGAYWAENANAAGRRACAVAAVAGLVAVAVAARVLVPLGGGTGALTAFLAGAAVQAATAAALLRR